jgi:hypothetical protein
MECENRLTDEEFREVFKRELALCVERVGKRTSSTPLRKKIDTRLASGLIRVEKVQASWAMNRGCVLIAYASSTWGCRERGCDSQCIVLVAS